MQPGSGLNELQPTHTVSWRDATEGAEIQSNGCNELSWAESTHLPRREIGLTV